MSKKATSDAVNVSEKEIIIEEKFKVSEFIEAHEKLGYPATLIAVALDGCTELTKAEALAKISAFAKRKH